MNKQQLQCMASTLLDKLNAWAGTKNIDYTHPDWGIAYCFKWLVPKLQDKGHNIDLLAFECKGFRADISDNVFSQNSMSGYEPYRSSVAIAEDNNPALALCLAIERLIDNELENANR